MNYYQILEIDIGADDNLIKKSFRQLSKKHHPDKGGDELIYKKITEAYNVLGNLEKKKEYDNLLFTVKPKQQTIILSEDEEDYDNIIPEQTFFRPKRKPTNYFQKRDPFENVINKFMQDNRNYINLDDDDDDDDNDNDNERDEKINILLKKLYNDNHLSTDILEIISNNFPYDISHITNLWRDILQKESQTIKEEKKTYKISTPISNLMTTNKKKIVINYSKVCTKCLGTFKYYKCRGCLTTYKKKMNRCLECHTNLKTIYCKNCKGTGKLNKKLSLNIALYMMEIIPKNYKNIVIQIIPKNCDNFNIVNNIDLKTKHNISLYDCIFGTTIKVKYFTQKILVIKIPPRVSIHTPFIVKNYGIFDKTGTNRGNLLIELIIKYPQNINEKNKLLIKSLS
jgi:DnaJ-class molecular chaperone